MEKKEAFKSNWSQNIRPHRSQQVIHTLVLIALAIMSTPLYAGHFGALGEALAMAYFLMFIGVIGVPLAALFYLWAAFIIRKFFKLRSFIYWVAALLLLFPWLVIYLFLSLELLESYKSSLSLSILLPLLLPLLPLAPAILLRRASGESERVEATTERVEQGSRGY